MTITHRSHDSNTNELFFQQMDACDRADSLSRELFRENIFFIQQKSFVKNRPVTKQ
jgi:hypothetical protein